MGDTLEQLQEWFADHCDGDWEHGNGVKIDSLDNPGWSLAISLAGTPLEGKTIEKVRHERSEADWIWLWVEEDVFNGCGGAGNLREIVSAFLAWAQQNE